MGSRSKINLSYIAGFLDGDGSLMLQIKKRKDGRLKRRFMAANLLSKKQSGRLTRSELLRLVGYISVIQSNNYVTKRKKTKDELLKILDLTP